MAQDSSELYGKKIFFLNTAYLITKEIIPSLQEAEYEVYTIDSYHEAKNILRRFPNSILYVIMNSDFSAKGWFNYIKSLENDDAFKGLTLGVIAEKIKEEDKKPFMTGANLEGGFFNLSTDKNEKILEDMKNVLDMNNAKGRRQFVRANCTQDKEAKMFWTFKDKMHMFQLLDISSVGMAALAPSYVGQYIQKDSILGNVSLLLDGKQYEIECKVFNISLRENALVAVFLLNPKLNPAAKDSIRKYIHATLKKTLIQECYSPEKDLTNYNTTSSFEVKAENNSESQNQ